jgi:hypothetical protein
MQKAALKRDSPSTRRNLTEKKNIEHQKKQQQQAKTSLANPSFS